MRGVALALLLGACTAAQTAATQTAGQLYCARATAAGPLVAALADAAQPGAPPVSVIGQSAAAVGAACTAWDAAAVPVSPPARAVPTVAVRLAGA